MARITDIEDLAGIRLGLPTVVKLHSTTSLLLCVTLVLPAERDPYDIESEGCSGMESLAVIIRQAARLSPT